MFVVGLCRCLWLGGLRTVFTHTTLQLQFSLWQQHKPIIRPLASRRNASPPAINPTRVSVQTHGPSILHRWVTHANIACKTKGDLNRKPKAEEFWILPTMFLMIAPSPLVIPTFLPGGLAFGARAASVQIVYRAALCSAADSSLR